MSMKKFTLKTIIPLLALAFLAFDQVQGQTVTLNPSATQNISTGGTVNFTATRSSNSQTWPGGNSSFTYTWSSNPAGVTFTNNPGSGGSSSSTVATFPSNGSYQITCFVQEGGGGLNATSPATTVNVTTPVPSNLWASSGSGSAVTGFAVNLGTVLNGPTAVFNPTFPGTTTGATYTSAIGRSDKPTVSLGHFYWIGNTSNNNGVVEIWGANSTGGSPTRIGSIDMNGAGSNTSLGFVRLGMDPQGKGYILAGNSGGGSTLYLASFTTNLLAPVTPVIVDNDVTLVGGAASTFQNGDLCFDGSGNLYALANNGSGTTQIFVGAPNGSSTTLTKKWDLVDNANNPFTGSVNGVAFTITGSLYITTSVGLYYIDATTVNGPAGTVQTSLSYTQSGMHDLASNVFPNTILLPIKLGAFTVSKQGTNGALVSWKTTSEINVDHFEIERSFDGINFVSVGTKQAVGNSASDVDYQFNDLIPSGTQIVYYRLKTLDIDAKSSYSKIIALKLQGIFVSDFSVYPNPFTTDLKIQMNSEKEENVTIRISNAVGQSIVNRKSLLQKGENIIVISSELARLQKGMYILEVITESGKQTQKIIKK